MSRITRQVVGSRSRPGSQALEEKLLAALEQNEQLVVLASSLATHALPNQSNSLAALVRTVATRFPARFYGMGELLADLVPTATRLVAEGQQPLVLLSSADLARSYAGMSALCAQQLRVIFLLAAGPLPGQTWRPSGTNDLAILRTLTSLYIGMPGNAEELISHLAEATQVDDHPVALYYREELRMPRNVTALKPLGRSLGIGKAIMLREGKELALLSLGPATTTALALGARLDELGHPAAVVDVRWMRPLDEPLLTAVAHHFPRLVTLEEGSLESSFGAALLEMLERRGLYETRLKRLEVTPKPKLAELTASVMAFLDTLKRDEGLTPPLPQHLRPLSAH